MKFINEQNFNVKDCLPVSIIPGYISRHLGTIMPHMKGKPTTTMLREAVMSTWFKFSIPIEKIVPVRTATTPPVKIQRNQEVRAFHKLIKLEKFFLHMIN